MVLDDSGARWAGIELPARESSAHVEKSNTESVEREPRVVLAIDLSQHSFEDRESRCAVGAPELISIDQVQQLPSPAAVEHQGDKKSSAGLTGFIQRTLKRFGELADPRYHYEQFKIDLATYRESKKLPYDEICTDLDKLATSFQGKLFSSLLLSNVIGYAGGAAASAIYQGATSDPVSSTLVFFASSYAAAVGSFQWFWARANASMYAEYYSNPLKRCAEFEKDLWPCHSRAFSASMVCYTISVPLSLAIGQGIGLMGETAAQFLPAGVMSYIATAPLEEGIFIRLLGDFHKGYCRDLAQKYLRRSETKEGRSAVAN